MKGRWNGGPPTQHDVWLRDVAALPVRLLGLGIPKPTETADRDYKTSAAASEAITEAILRGEDIDADEHLKRGQKARAAHKEAVKEAVQKEWERLGSQSGQAASEDQCEEVRQSKEKRQSGWLTATPLKEHGMNLSPDEFRDAMTIRYQRRVGGRRADVRDVGEGGVCNTPLTAQSGDCRRCDMTKSTVRGRV
uniref:Uncharacterized protein n=1 Tax=Chromera velia CCMP2878 TaxID=1169474 RepID=A0A0G4H2M4_9ALVE|eukprot:Cvel_24450.t1-p1 / transcript=Cvel_24450.t1 / gene=Cvel_24450 / organism=Chromera_velia_CCMP2878 / gene_product=hypothetical protein / transcript_product=hypothetical protein / location=Cvel_scaffold2643:24406-24981(-) / protein_length=192 / sequence_SO=supercontig / SO=protein_coding / is_pseudo=false